MASSRRKSKKAFQRSNYRQRYGIGIGARGHDAEKRGPRGWIEVYCPQDKLYLKPSRGAISTKCGRCRRVFRSSRAGW